MKPSWVYLDQRPVESADPAAQVEAQVEALYTCITRSPQAAEAVKNGDASVSWLNHVGPDKPGYTAYKRNCKKRVVKEHWRAQPFSEGSCYWICEAKCHRGEWWPLLETVRFTLEGTQKYSQKNNGWFTFKEAPKGDDLKYYHIRCVEQVAYQRRKSDRDQLRAEILESHRTSQMQMRNPTGPATTPLNTQMRQPATRSTASEYHLAKRPREDDNLSGDSQGQGLEAMMESPRTSHLRFKNLSEGFSDGLFNEPQGSSGRQMDDTAESLPACGDNISQRNLEKGLRAIGTALKLDMRKLPQDAVSEYARCLIEKQGFDGPEFLQHFTHSRQGSTSRLLFPVLVLIESTGSLCISKSLFVQGW